MANIRVHLYLIFTPHIRPTYKRVGWLRANLDMADDRIGYVN
jgi:hypothetical protein